MAAHDHGDQPSLFLTTHWSVVVAAGQEESARARDAMATLCRTYWQPLYAYVRRRGYTAHDAEDLTQGFFASILERDDVATVRRESGKFRSYLLAAMNHYLSDARDRAQAQKRGGGKVLVLDFQAAESAYLHPTVDSTATPDHLFDQQWALTLLQDVLRRLRREHEQAGKTEWFEALAFSLTGERGDRSYAELAQDLRTTEGAIKVGVHRLRRRYRRLLRDLIAETVSTPDDVEEELRELLRALAQRSVR